MSTWISFVGGIEKVTARRYEDEVQSTNLHPTANRISASLASSFADVLPVSPMPHAFRGWSSEIAPLPFHVVTTAAPIRSSRATKGADASSASKPPPAT